MLVSYDMRPREHVGDVLWMSNVEMSWQTYRRTSRNVMIELVGHDMLSCSFYDMWGFHDTVSRSCDGFMTNRFEVMGGHHCMTWGCHDINLPWHVMLLWHAACVSGCHDTQFLGNVIISHIRLLCQGVWRVVGHNVAFRICFDITGFPCRYTAGMLEHHGNIRMILELLFNVRITGNMIEISKYSCKCDT